MEKRMKIYKAGIIGCGNIAGKFDKTPGKKPIYTHAGAYFVNPQTEIVAAADSNKNNLSEFAKKWQVKNVYSDFKTMLEKEDLDIVSICTPKELHFDAVKCAAKHGVKAILCEKPFTGSVSKAEYLVKYCRNKGVLLAINYTRRYASGHQDVKEIIKKEQIGKIQAVNCFYTKGLFNSGSHLINLLLFFFGKINKVSLISRLKKCPVMKKDYDGDIALRFSSGFTAIIISADARCYSLFEIDIIGTLGRIKITESGFKIVRYRVRNSPVFKGYKELEPKGISITNGIEDSIINAVDNIIKVYEEDEPLLCSGRDGVETLKILENTIKLATLKQ
jgi:predicted dehydrogenase